MRVIFEKRDGTMQHGIVSELKDRVRLIILLPTKSEIDYELTDIYEGIIAVYKEIQ